jgi:hypothetical protein
VDAAAHRAGLPPVYNQYARIQRPLARALEDAQMLFRPLFTTAFLLDDLLAEEGCFGASRVLLASASSKTALSLAFLLGRRSGARPEVVGLTSRANRAFTESTGCYDRVIDYDAIETLPIAPSDRARKRAADWGAAGFEARRGELAAVHRRGPEVEQGRAPHGPRRRARGLSLGP